MIYQKKLKKTFRVERGNLPIKKEEFGELKKIMDEIKTDYRVKKYRFNPLAIDYERKNRKPSLKMIILILDSSIL